MAARSRRIRYACLQLLDSVSTTLVDLPKPKEPETIKTSERGS